MKTHTEDLVTLAYQASRKAYAPYSHFSVGAVVVAQDDTIYTGCNIENASYGLTNCAERTAIFSAISKGVRQLSKIVIYGDTEEPIAPCGACRQVMTEFCKPSTPVLLVSKNKTTVEMTVGDLLPYTFSHLK